MINTHRKPKRLKVETGLANKIILSMGVEFMYCLMILLLKSYPYHFVRTILSNTILSVYHFVHTILSVPFCPLPFCPRTGLCTLLTDFQNLCDKLAKICIVTSRLNEQLAQD